MNNEEMHTMDDIVSVAKYLVVIWCRSKCPDECSYLFPCQKCKYKELCERLDELAKVVDI